MPPLNQPQYSAAATMCDGRFYVISTTVETWSPGEPAWTVLTVPIPFEIGIHHAVTIRNYVYRLDPNTKCCEKLGKMVNANGPSCVLHNVLYVTGGTGDMAAVESFDTENSEVEKVVSVNYDLKIKEFCVAVLPSYPVTPPP